MVQKKNRLTKNNKAKKILKDTPEQERHIGVIIEDYESKFDIILENLDSFRNEYKRDMADFRKEVNDRFDLLAQAFKTRSSNIEKKVGEVEKDGLELKVAQGSIH